MDQTMEVTMEVTTKCHHAKIQHVHVLILQTLLQNHGTGIVVAHIKTLLIKISIWLAQPALRMALLLTIAALITNYWILVTDQDQIMVETNQNAWMLLLVHVLTPHQQTRNHGTIIALALTTVLHSRVLIWQVHHAQRMEQITLAVSHHHCWTLLCHLMVMLAVHALHQTVLVPMFQWDLVNTH